MSYYDEQICNNSYIDKIVLYNHDTGKYFQPKCKSYGCPKHGFIQRKRLEDALTKWLRKYDVIRFWTFTLRTDPQFSTEENNILFKKAWHRFITELRRSKLLTKRQQKLQYVKVFEHTKKGILHVHLFSTEYIHYAPLQQLWDFCLSRFFGDRNKQGNVHCKAHKHPKTAAKYIAKYVSKEAGRKESKIRVWSKSGNIAIFDKRISSGDWFIIRKTSLNYLLLQNDVPILVRDTPSVTKSVYKKRDIPDHPKMFKEYFDYFLNSWIFDQVI